MFLYFLYFRILKNKIYSLSWLWFLPPSVIHFVLLSPSLSDHKILYFLCFVKYTSSLLLEPLPPLFPLPGVLCLPSDHCATSSFISPCSMYHILGEDQPNWSHRPAPTFVFTLSLHHSSPSKIILCMGLFTCYLSPPSKMHWPLEFTYLEYHCIQEPRPMPDMEQNLIVLEFVYKLKT